jgi:hypothetical protein
MDEGLPPQKADLPKTFRDYDHARQLADEITQQFTDGDVPRDVFLREMTDLFTYQDDTPIERTLKEKIALVAQGKEAQDMFDRLIPHCRIKEILVPYTAAEFSSAWHEENFQKQDTRETQGKPTVLISNSRLYSVSLLDRLGVSVPVDLNKPTAAPIQIWVQGKEGYLDIPDDSKHIFLYLTKLAYAQTMATIARTQSQKIHVDESKIGWEKFKQAARERAMIEDIAAELIRKNTPAAQWEQLLGSQN